MSLGKESEPMHQEHGLLLEPMLPAWTHGASR